MAELRDMLKVRVGDSPDDFIFEVNRVVKPDVKEKIAVSTLYAYLNGTRDIAGKGAKILAQYFHTTQDMDMVKAITEVTLGIPYPMPEVNSDGN